MGRFPVMSVGAPSRKILVLRNSEAVRWLMLDECLNLVARGLNVTAAEFSGWQNCASLGAGLASMDRSRDLRDDETSRLKFKAGDSTKESGATLKRRKSNR